jgi:uncharacterized RDD family membrane protein YckC
VTNPYAPPTAPVDDVVVANAESELAGRGVRLGAWLLDSIILGAMVGLPLLFGMIIAFGFSGGDLERAPSLWAVPVTLFLIGLVAWAVLTIKYVVANGQSIGKKILGIKVVRLDGSPASLGRIFWLRNVVNSVIGAVPILGVLYGIIDPLFIFGEEKRCVHDRIADTIVVVA